MEPLQTEDYLFLNDLTIVGEINNLKSEVDSYRPLDRDTESRIMQKFRLDWNYNSNAIEGNSLDYGETLAFLMHGITAKGKPLKDYLDIRGHNEAINFLQDIVKNNDDLRESDVRALHKMLLVEPYQTPSQTVEGLFVQKTIRLGEYKRTANHVITVTGETHYYASPEDTSMLMTDLMDWYRVATSENRLHPVIIAAIFHHRFASIHPFDDGNGRMSRLLMNLIVMKYAYPPIVIKNSDKKEYYLALSQADSGSIGSFIEFVGGNVINSLNLYIKGARGESVEESSDLRKKITLFKREVEARKDKIETRRSLDIQKKILEESVLPLIRNVFISLSDFKDLFLAYGEYEVHLLTGTDKAKVWSYSEVKFLEKLEKIFYNNQIDNNIEVMALEFFNFITADNPFSVEIKIVIELLEFSYIISYSVSETYELKRLNKVKYSQWMYGGFLEKYYHQQISEEEQNQLITNLGENFLVYIRSAFEKPELLESELSATDISNLWNDFISNTDIISPDTALSLKNAVKISYSKDNGYISIDIPSPVYEKTSLEDRERIEIDFVKLVKNKSKSLKKIFVDVF